MSDHGANQHNRLDWTKPDDLEVGRMVDVPFRLASNMVVVRCRVIDRRSVFGRMEWKIAPISGRGEAWVQERSFSDDSPGVKIVSPSTAARHGEGITSVDDEPNVAAVDEANHQRNAEATAPGLAARQVRRST